MSRFYFDVQDGRVTSLDDEGIVVARQETVRNAAIDALRELAAEWLPDADHHIFAVNVRDEAGRVVFTATLTLDTKWIGVETDPH